MGLAAILPVSWVGSNPGWSLSADTLRGFLNMFQAGRAIYEPLSPQLRTRLASYQWMLFGEEKCMGCIIDCDLGSNVTKFCKTGSVILNRLSHINRLPLSFFALPDASAVTLPTHSSDGYISQNLPCPQSGAWNRPRMGYHFFYPDEGADPAFDLI